jgi:predicted PhzF superfamily epimerase YddE/YHI9
VSRYLAPIFGIPEDPVTGSAHCTLGPFWRDLLGKDELRALQVSRRVGELNVRVAGRRIYLGGRAITVIRGYLSREASV